MVLLSGRSYPEIGWQVVEFLLPVWGLPRLYLALVVPQVEIFFKYLPYPQSPCIALVFFYLFCLRAICFLLQAGTFLCLYPAFAPFFSSGGKWIGSFMLISLQTFKLKGMWREISVQVLLHSHPHSPPWSLLSLAEKHFRAVCCLLSLSFISSNFLNSFGLYFLFITKCPLKHLSAEFFPKFFIFLKWKVSHCYF